MKTINNKADYLSELQKHLKRLPKSEIDDAVLFYDEYFEDRGEESFGQALNSLGTPKEVAFSIICEKAITEQSDTPVTAKKGFKTVMLALLAVFASPIALPLAIMFFVVLLMVVICLAMAMLMVFIAFAGSLVMLTASGVAIFVGGFMYIGISLPILVQHIATALFMAGTGIAAVGAGALLSLASFKLWQLFIKAIKFILRGLVSIINRKLLRRKTA